MANMKTPQISQRVRVSLEPGSNAKESTELDYRILVPGDFTHSSAGQHKDGDGSLAQRKVREIKGKRDFKIVMEDLAPKIQISVANKLSDDPQAQMDVKLEFKDVKDFHPDEIVKKVEPMQKLLETRNKLKQLKLMVLKDQKLRKGIEDVLKEGSGSIDSLLSKLSAEK